MHEFCAFRNLRQLFRQRRCALRLRIAKRESANRKCDRNTRREPHGDQVPTFGLLTRSTSGSGRHTVLPYVPPARGYVVPTTGLNGRLNRWMS
jgi:hypothetical protein